MNMGINESIKKIIFWMVVILLAIKGYDIIKIKFGVLGAFIFITVIYILNIAYIIRNNFKKQMGNDIPKDENKLMRMTINNLKNSARVILTWLCIVIMLGIACDIICNYSADLVVTDAYVFIIFLSGFLLVSIFFELLSLFTNRLVNVSERFLKFLMKLGSKILNTLFRK